MSKFIKLTKVDDDEFSPLRFRKSVIVPVGSIVRIEENESYYTIGVNIIKNSTVYLQNGDVEDLLDVEETVEEVQAKIDAAV